MEEKLECVVCVIVWLVVVRLIKFYKGGDVVFLGNKGENDLYFWD